MAKKKKNQIITVEDREISIKKINDEDYVSLNDMAGKGEVASRIIYNWLQTISTLEYLGEWETIYNPNFNSLRFQGIRSEAGTVRFTMSVKEWIEETGAIGLVSKAGRYGGTFAHRDIAFEFGTRISARFKILLIKEFQRLKSEEYSRQRLEWDYQRFLTKVNYRLHTDTIKEVIIPRIQEQQRQTPAGLVYAEEADLLNLAVFGITAKQWREANPEQAKSGNIRDYAEIVQLNVLANIESMNAILIEQGLDKEKRFQILAQASISQYRRLSQNDNLKQIED